MQGRKLISGVALACLACGLLTSSARAGMREDGDPIPEPTTIAEYIVAA